LHRTPPNTLSAAATTKPLCELRHVSLQIRPSSRRRRTSSQLLDMFQTFSGNSRRPRQVNLSGQNLNPFAASSWTPSASGTQQTVANAQQERQQRQQDRDRLHATKRIQRTWRGHRVRRDLADVRRRAWDDADASDRTSALLVEHTQLLIAFFSPRREDDVDRLISLSQRISAAGYGSFLARQDIQPQIVRLSTITL
jgi:ubiquitin-protein ligase E3 C